MKKLMMMSASVIALGAMAQEVPVPPPVVAVETTVAVPTVPVAPVVATAPVVELEPGALCKVYYRGTSDFYAMTFSKYVEGTEEWLASAIPVDQAYDAKATKFDGKNVAKHNYDVASWEGIFEAKLAGQYVFTVDSGFICGVAVNGQGFKGVGQSSFVANLAKGANKIAIWKVVNERCKDWDRFALDYRLASSTKPAKPITPNMLKHIVEDEEVW